MTKKAISKAAKPGPGRPVNPDNDGGRWGVYLAKKFQGPVSEAARIERRTSRAQIETAIVEMLARLGIKTP